MDLGLKGKNVLVVGASKGIGRAIALSFASEHARVTAIARSDNLLKELLGELRTISNIDHAYYVKDLMTVGNESFLNQIIATRGNFDIVIQNVGGSLVSRNPLGEYDEWLYAWKFNAGIAIELNHILIPPMITNGWGRVIHISSISAQMLRGNPLYASAKAFLNAYVTTVGRALATSGVVMSAVMPGAVVFPGSYWDKKQKDSGFPEKGKRNGMEEVRDFLSHHQAVNRFGTPQEIANFVLFMASNQASFMQAAIIPVDGANM